MLRNYLKVAWRNLMKHKLFSFINIFGLAMSMAVGLIVIMVVKQAYSYDKFHPEMDRFYRIITEVRLENNTKRYASSPLPLAEQLVNNYDFVEKTVRIKRGVSSEVSTEHKTLSLEGVFTEPPLFDLFAFTLISGNKTTALIEPNSVILSEETAAKFFKKDDPLGKTLYIKQFATDFKVTGVIKTPPQNSRFLQDIYISWSSLAALEKGQKIDPVLTNWNHYRGGQTFIRVKKGVNKKTVEQALTVVAGDINKVIDNSIIKDYTFELQPFYKISPPAEYLGDNFGAGRLMAFFYVCIALGLILLLSACFNYTNLSIARSLTRAREVGLRKVAGAKRSQIFFQFLTESLLYSFLALGIAYCLLTLMSDISFVRDIISNAKQDAELWIYFLAFSLVTGLLAGYLPAWALSSFKPIQTLKDLKGIKVFKGLALRKILVVIQFSVSLIFMIVLTVIFRQSQFMLKSDYGFDKKNFVHIPLGGASYQKMYSELIKNKQVEKATANSNVIGTYVQHYANVQPKELEQPIRLGYFSVDKNFIEVMKLNLVAGSTFPPAASDSVESYIILNEKAISLLKMGSPEQALGKTVFVRESIDRESNSGQRIPLTIIGVLKDFIYQNMMYDINAMALRFKPVEFEMISLKLKSAADKQTLALLEHGWKQINPLNDFSYSTFEDEFHDIYNREDNLSVLLFLTLLTISLSCLGILGITTYTAQTRAKEIGIRKVMGASVRNIVTLLSRNLLVLLCIAGIIALPVSLVAGKMILQQFANRIDFSVWLLLIPFLIIVLLTLLTVGSQTIKTALANPVKSLRTE